MQIVTLTTDFGLQDHYVASLKGAILNQIPGAIIIDISHSIPAFNVANAAYQLKSSYRFFPENTIHIVAVDSEPDIKLKIPSLPSVLHHENQFFIGNNNGFFGAFLEDQGSELFFQMEPHSLREDHYKFTSIRCFAPIAGRIHKKEKLNAFLSKSEQIKRAFFPKPIVESNKLLGQVIHIDSLGNIITNISKAEFYRFGREIPFTIYYASRDHFIDKISTSYNDVVPGEKLALFNMSDFLEIAVNKGVNSLNAGASKLFGMKVGDNLTVEFNPPGSVKDINSLF